MVATAGPQPLHEPQQRAPASAASLIEEEAHNRVCTRRAGRGGLTRENLHRAGGMQPPQREGPEAGMNSQRAPSPNDSWAGVQQPVPARAVPLHRGFWAQESGDLFRLLPLSRAQYLSDWFHCLDAVVIVTSFYVELLSHGIIEDIASLVIVFRLFRFAKMVEEMSMGTAERI
ncbi:predicted protein [Verticillium alfalfae VaMs.102]|uniref:Predicted protein n=1 Tax=Verticillium alfalfae (strain VaMs.102 / ATCC MYA-4576 / FGSC 10136) TaxID=526221 RepID=C9S620_VERA1|nr:predicted protein [Verticillium alfalfae VaMs.102]EEY14359.1 predicted protein [Verticillium alfalfae VaMs.102]